MQSLDPPFFNHAFVFMISHILIYSFVRYKLPKDIAKWLEITEDTGHIKVRNPMDREASFIKDGQYTVLIEAYDNGNFLVFLRIRDLK